MAASVAATMGLASVVPVRNVSSLSSSASFGSPLVSVAPLRPVAKRNVMIARAALPEENSGKTARREMMASLMAAGALLATAGSSIAASGPGTPGGQRTNEKAGELLKAADKLTTDESPPRFGPGRGTSSDDTGRIAQKGGAGAVQDLQGAGGDSIEGAKSAVAKAKKRIDGIFGKKTGDISDASGVLNDLKEGKVAFDSETVKGKVSSDVGSTKDTVADAQSKIDGSTKEGKDVIGGLVDNLKGALPQ